MKLEAYFGNTSEDWARMFQVMWNNMRDTGRATSLLLSCSLDILYSSCFLFLCRCCTIGCGLHCLYWRTEHFTPSLKNIGILLYLSSCSLSTFCLFLSWTCFTCAVERCNYEDPEFRPLPDTEIAGFSNGGVQDASSMSLGTWWIWGFCNRSEYTFRQPFWWLLDLAFPSISTCLAVLHNLQGWARSYVILNMALHFNHLIYLCNQELRLDSCKLQHSAGFRG
jgi:hypothetical protein